MGYKRLTSIWLLFLALAPAGCRKGATPSKTNLDNSLPILNVSGSLKSMESKTFAFQGVMNPSEISLKVVNGYELLKKYRDFPDAAVWVIDARSGQRLFGTLYGAAGVIEGGNSKLEILVENTTQEEVEFQIFVKK